MWCQWLKVITCSQFTKARIYFSMEVEDSTTTTTTLCAPPVQVERAIMMIVVFKPRPTACCFADILLCCLPAGLYDMGNLAAVCRSADGKSQVVVAGINHPDASGWSPYGESNSSSSKAPVLESASNLMEPGRLEQ